MSNSILRNNNTKTMFGAAKPPPCGGVVAADDLPRLLQQMERDSQNLDKATKREYNIAVEAVEAVVRNETPLLSFLRTDKFDTQKAAARVARYWKYRYELFGERWLLPMTMTTRGALSVQDVIYLKRGVVMMLPVPNAPPIVFSDASKAFDLFRQYPKAANDGSLDRVSMYWGTVCTNELAQTDGCTLFQIVTADKRPTMDYRTRMWDMIHSALPININRLAVAQSHEEGKEALLEFLRTQTATICSFNARLPAEEYHGHSLQQTILRLEKHGGFSRDFIPISLGGSLDFDGALNKFIGTRLGLEDIMGPGVVFGSTATPMELVAYAAPQATKRSTKKQGDGNLSHQEEKNRNALYSRRSYHRRKVQLVSLEEQVRSWKDMNEKAKKEGQRLEMLVKQSHVYCGNDPKLWRLFVMICKNSCATLQIVV